MADHNLHFRFRFSPFFTFWLFLLVFSLPTSAKPEAPGSLSTANSISGPIPKLQNTSTTAAPSTPAPPAPPHDARGKLRQIKLGPQTFSFHLENDTKKYEGSARQMIIRYAQRELWYYYVGWPTGTGSVVGFLLVLALLHPYLNKDKRLVLGIFGFLGVADIFIGLCLAILTMEIATILVMPQLQLEDILFSLPIFYGFILQIVSGIWRLVSVFAFKNPLHSHLCMALWLLCFLPSVMSPFALAAGIPSIVLIGFWFYKIRQDSRGFPPPRPSQVGPENSTGGGSWGQVVRTGSKQGLGQGQGQGPGRTQSGAQIGGPKAAGSPVRISVTPPAPTPAKDVAPRPRSSMRLSTVAAALVPNLRKGK